MPTWFSCGPSAGTELINGDLVGRRDGRAGGRLSDSRHGGRLVRCAGVGTAGRGDRRRRTARRSRRDLVEHLRGGVGKRRLAAEHGEDRLHVLAIDVRDEHRRPVDVPVRRFDLVGEDRLRVDVVHHTGELERPCCREVAVGDDVLGCCADEAASNPRVEWPLVEDARQRSADEVLLARDPTKVARRVLLPVSAARRILVLVVPRADVGEGVLAVEREASGRRHVEPSVVVSRRELERDGDTTNGVDQRLEGTKVDLDVVVDRDAEVLEDRQDQSLRVVAPVGRVDP